MNGAGSSHPCHARRERPIRDGRCGPGGDRRRAEGTWPGRGRSRRWRDRAQRPVRRRSPFRERAAYRWTARRPAVRVWASGTLPARASFAPWPPFRRVSIAESRSSVTGRAAPRPSSSVHGRSFPARRGPRSRWRRGLMRPPGCTVSGSIRSQGVYLCVHGRPGRLRHRRSRRHGLPLRARPTRLARVRHSAASVSPLRARTNPFSPADHSGPRRAAFGSWSIAHRPRSRRVAQFRDPRSHPIRAPITAPGLPVDEIVRPVRLRTMIAGLDPDRTFGVSDLDAPPYQSTDNRSRPACGRRRSSRPCSHRDRRARHRSHLPGSGSTPRPIRALIAPWIGPAGSTSPNPSVVQLRSRARPRSHGPSPTSTSCPIGASILPLCSPNPDGCRSAPEPRGPDPRRSARSDATSGTLSLPPMAPKNSSADPWWSDVARRANVSNTGRRPAIRSPVTTRLLPSQPHRRTDRPSLPTAHPPGDRARLVRPRIAIAGLEPDPRHGLRRSHPGLSVH